MPERIQRKRTKGWRSPDSTIYVGRPSKWGNPFTVSDYPAECSDGLCHSMAAIDYWQALLAGCLDYTVEDVRRELKGKNLACWCPLDLACHAGVLLKIANREIDDNHER